MEEFKNKRDQNDITERKRMEEELRKHRNHLEELVAERTAKLKAINEQLQWEITERKRAEEIREKLLREIEEVNQRKSEFVSDVSHELRTPLASIKGFVSTIRSDKEMDKKTREEFLKIVEEESDRLTRIIEELLDLSRIESGRIKLKLGALQMLDLIHKNVENLQGQAKGKDIIIEQKMPSELPLVHADQDKTTQIIINLLSNAIKYNKKGGKVVVSAREENEKVMVEIQDTGIGISEKDLPHIFEKFYRVEKPTAEAKGAGLGLAVTKSLLEVQGGEISVESQVGKGSKFCFTLPKRS